MAAAVDFCPPARPSMDTATAKIGEATTADFTCTACSESFATNAELRAHCKTERHLYNMKRRLAGLRPISKELWDKKLQESRNQAAAQKGTAHLKAGKEPRKTAGSTTASQPTPSAGGSDAPEASPSATPDEGPLTPRHCLFDRRHFQTVDECLAYMQKTYSFSVPDAEYCTDVPGLLSFLHRKISEPPHACLFCNRKFPDLASVRRHMIDKGHTRIGTEARTRRGNVDQGGTDELQAELEDFYDYTASTREVTDRVRDPAQKVASLVRFFDADRDGKLLEEELKEFWTSVTDGQEFTESQYTGACRLAGVNPADGLDADALLKLYNEGFADLDAHFEVLKELLTQRWLRRRKDTDDTDEEEEEEEDDEDDDEDDEDEEEEGDSEGDSDGSEGDVLECDDEDEFEEIMRVLGLQPVSILPNGDLRLPSGSVAVHRDVAYVYKQRGQRLDPLALTASSASGRRSNRPRSQLMLSNGGSGCSKLAVSQRGANREGKRIIAVLLRQQMSDMRLGLKRNILQTKSGKHIRTGRGDCSAGR